ncbi:50S ribosomal protein L31 [bacterium]|nr:50S ribosomal protein L31 [bacterium]
MKENIHPNYKIVDVTCACGATYQIGTTKKVDSMKVEICAQCHPFYTGKQKNIQSGGRVERFNKRFGESALK